MEQRLARMEAMMAEMQEQMDAQTERIKVQEKTIAHQKAALEGTPERVKKLEQNLEEKRASNDESDAWFRNVGVGGLVEVEFGHHSPYEGDSESDIVLATFELGISAQVTDWIETGGTLLYEEDATDLEVDVVYVTLANGEASPLFLTAGQIYVPFGAFETNLVSDPLTLEIGEARETALQGGFVSGGFSGSVYVFNGSNKNDGKNQIGSWGANLGYVAESDTLSWAAGIGYINDLGDSDSLQGLIADNLGGNDIETRVGGWTLHAGVQFGPFNLIGEYLAATDAFDRAAVPWKQNGAEPKAFNVEVGYGFDLLGKGATLALAYQGSREALALELPRERWLLGLSIDILDNTALSFEWAHDEDYSVADGGTGKSADTATALLAVEF